MYSPFTYKTILFLLTLLISLHCQIEKNIFILLCTNIVRPYSSYTCNDGGLVTRRQWLAGNGTIIMSVLIIFG